MNRLTTYLNKPFFRHLFFWMCVYLYFTLSVNISNYSGYEQLLESNNIIVGLQIITAYTCIYFLFPKFFRTKKNISFIFSLLILLLIMLMLYNFYRVCYYDPKYFESYSEIGKKYARVSYWNRLLNFSFILGKSIKFLTPTALLMMFRFYKDQQNLLKLNEQKKTAELTALKNQLNPHFLFNTLNNLYALALEKSDRTPEVIERLSDMLDYMLYRCKDNFVILQKEITLIDNYLALEKIRYGKRVMISFINHVEKELKIAPLILLAFIENAFKHGVSQELKTAKIDIVLALNPEGILFSIYNTKPNIIAKNEPRKTESLGLKNVKKQLELLYPNAYDLEIIDTDDSYVINLILKEY